MDNPSHILSKTLPNGLRVVIESLPHSQVVVVNAMYQVGSRNENRKKTGMAHLLEHVMCGGSVHISNYDQVLQGAGAESNAYTSFDVTNYWSLLPAIHLEKALWVESERMFFSKKPKTLVDIQKKVVLEEFKQVDLAKPYGDVWHHLLPMAYDIHPYRSPIIGQEFAHIESISASDLAQFAQQYYHPQNAVLTIVGGGVDLDFTYKRVEDWFSPMPTEAFSSAPLPQEPLQKKEKRTEISRKVPQDALYLAYHMGAYGEDTHWIAQLLVQILAGGKSALLYHELVEKRSFFTEIHAYTLDTLDPELLIIEGRVSANVALASAEEAVRALCTTLWQEKIAPKTFEKAVHQVEADYYFEQIQPTEKAIDLAWGSLLGDPLWNRNHIAKIREIPVQKLASFAHYLFQPSNTSVLYYKAESTG